MTPGIGSEEDVAVALRLAVVGGDQACWSWTSQAACCDVTAPRTALAAA
jgi:hypothetical protein